MFRANPYRDVRECAGSDEFAVLARERAIIDGQIAFGSSIGRVGQHRRHLGFDELSSAIAVLDTREREPCVDRTRPPTIQMQFAVNDGPLAGQGRQNSSLPATFRERLYKEIRTNISLIVRDTEAAYIFLVSARGEMQIACSSSRCDAKVTKCWFRVPK